MTAPLQTRENYKRWSAAEKQKLAQLAQEHQKNGRVDWAAVSEAMETRDVSQCKSQYAIVLKGRSSRPVQKWTQLEVATLVVAVEQHGTKWKRIRELYFPARDEDALRLKFAAVRKAAAGK